MREFKCLAVMRLVVAALVLAALPAAAADVEEAAKRIVEQTNAFRQAQGREPQAVNAALEQAAGDFAAFMAKNGKYGHAADGRTPAERAAAHGYDYCIVLENIAYLFRSTGYDTETLVQRFVEGWKNSPEHRKNLLERGATQTGAGVAQAQDGRYYGVQMFGRPKSAAIRFSVRNESGRRVEYQAGEREFSLPPRATRSHTVCRALQLRIALQKPFTARPSGGESYAIVERAGSLTVTRN